jgi:hypothetical protein
MNKHKFYADQFVAETELNDIQDKNEAHIEKYTEEVVSIDGFVFNGLATVATDPVSMTVKLELGSAWKNYKNIINYADLEQILDTADATLDRIDLIAFKYKTGDTDSMNVQFKDPVTGEVYVLAQNITVRDWIEIEYVAGTPAETPVAPEIPADCLGSSTILVEAGVTSVAQAKITDIRVSKPDYLVAGHRTANPIDHPNGSIFNVHIADAADINVSKLSGVDFASLYELIRFATDLPMVGSEVYERDINGKITTITHSARGIIERMMRNAETDILEEIQYESDRIILHEAYTRVAGKLSQTDWTLEVLP